VAALADGQWELDGLAFGNGTLIRVQQVSWDPGSMTVQDAPVVQGDGVRFGADTLPAMSLTVTGVIAAGNGQGGPALDLYEQLAAAWLNEDVRAAPGAYSTLRIRYPGSPGTRAVFGRGRRIAPTLGTVRQGVLGWVGQFDCASPYFYPDADSTMILTMLPSDITGVANIHNRLLNPTFDADVSNWAVSGLAIAYDAAHFHTAAGSARLTPPGAVAGVYTSGNCDNTDLVNPSRAYTFAAWVLAPTALSVPVQAQIAWFGAGGAPLGTTAGALVSPPAGAWTLVTATGNPPASSVTLDPRIAYPGTAAAADVVYLDDAAFIENIGGIAPPVTPPVILGGTADTANAAVVAGPSGYTGPGARAAWPVITITGPVTNPIIAYPAAGVSVKLQAAVPAGMTATIDTRPWQRSVTRSDGASLAGALRGNLLRDMALQPGSTAIRFSGQDPTGTARATITWRTPSATIGGST
jgi:hypothetical protein